jgi:hypothetical protein
MVETGGTLNTFFFAVKFFGNYECVFFFGGHRMG